jgi:hypothetical protein
MLTFIPAVKGDWVAEMLWKTTHRNEYERPKILATPKRPGMCQNASAAVFIAICRNLP